MDAFFNLIIRMTKSERYYDTPVCKIKTLSTEHLNEIFYFEMNEGENYEEFRSNKVHFLEHINKHECGNERCIFKQDRVALYDINIPIEDVINIVQTLADEAYVSFTADSACVFKNCLLKKLFPLSNIFVGPLFYFSNGVHTPLHVDLLCAQNTFLWAEDTSYNAKWYIFNTEATQKIHLAISNMEYNNTDMFTYYGTDFNIDKLNPLTNHKFILNDTFISYCGFECENDYRIFYQHVGETVHVGLGEAHMVINPPTNSLKLAIDGISHIDSNVKLINSHFKKHFPHFKLL